MVETKKIKVRVISDAGDLEFALIDVPLSDPRPAFDPAKGSLKERDSLQRGKAPEGAE